MEKLEVKRTKDTKRLECCIEDLREQVRALMKREDVIPNLVQEYIDSKMLTLRKKNIIMERSRKPPSIHDIINKEDIKEDIVVEKSVEVKNEEIIHKPKEEVSNIGEIKDSTIILNNTTTQDNKNKDITVNDALANKPIEDKAEEKQIEELVNTNQCNEVIHENKQEKVKILNEDEEIKTMPNEQEVVITSSNKSIQSIDYKSNIDIAKEDIYFSEYNQVTPSNQDLELKEIIQSMIANNEEKIKAVIESVQNELSNRIKATERKLQAVFSE